jgi:uncharacterized protein YndB with AHSA1/START domain
MLELTEEALVKASVDVVWAEFTEAALLSEWFWPERFETQAAIDPIPLGRWQVRSATAGVAVIGEILAIEPPRALRLRWRWDGEEHATDAGLALESAADESTRVIVRHAGFLTPDERKRHIQGWSDCLQRLIDRHA